MNNFFSFDATLKALTICFVFIFFQKTNAQSPVLTNTNLSPKAGDVFIFRYCKTNKYNTGVAGAKKVWDYSYLKDSVSAATHKKVIDTQTCILPSQTPYAGSFPHAKVATAHTIVPEFHYDYYSGGNYVAYWGYVLGFFNNVFSKSEPLTPKYPFSYGSNFFSTSEFTDGSNITYSGKDSLYAVGYGTLKLPNRTINNVVKIKQVHNYTSNVNTRTRVESYVFVTPDYHAGLLNLAHVKTTSLQNGATLLDSTVIWYAQNTSGLPLQDISFNTAVIDNFSKEHSMFSLSPNPSKDYINIVSSGNVANAQIKVTDISGRTLFTTKQNFIAGQTVKIYLLQFPSEVLIVDIKSNNSNEQFKIIKE